MKMSAITVDELLKKASGEFICVKMLNASMCGDRILKGDLLTVTRGDQLEDGRIGLFALADNKLLVRRLERQNGRCILRSSDRGSMAVMVAETELRIVGEVVAVSFYTNGAPSWMVDFAE